MSKCGIIFPRANDVHDISGCLREVGHLDQHICKDKDGKLIEWHYDIDCECGCWKDEFGNPCIVYDEVQPEDCIKYNRLEALKKNK